MGSIHSERRGDKLLVEDCLTLDLAWLMRLGPIGNGQAGSGEIIWRIDGAPVQSACYRLDLRDSAPAQLTIALNAGGIIRTPQMIVLTATVQPFGGHRWWMRCPMTGDRVRTLHLRPGGDRFASRKALGLIYRAERLGRFDRPFEKLFRAQRRLGGVQGLGMGLDRPKGMWRRTYARHSQQFIALDIACVETIAARIKNA